MNKLQNFSWQRVSIATVLLSYFYAFMEWVCFVTKPSFTSGMSVVSKAMVFFSTNGIVAFTDMVVILAFYIYFLALLKITG